MLDVAVIGAGQMGRTIIKHLLDDETVNRIVAQDPASDALVETQSLGPIEVTRDLDAVASDRKISLVFIASPNGTHAALTRRMLEAGKAVFCEKPMATTINDAKSVVAQAERTGAFLQIGFELRYSKLYTQAKKWIEQGLIGNIAMTHCNYICSEFRGKNSWRLNADTGGSMFDEKLCHYVDMPRWLVGSPVTEVFSMCASNVIPYYKVRDNYQTSFRFQSGAVGHITFMMALAPTFGGDPLQNVVDQQRDDGHELRHLIEGDRGAIELDVFHRRIRRWTFADTPDRMTSTLAEDLTWPADEDHSYFHNTTDQACDIVRRVCEGMPPMTDARDSLETMRLCFAAEQSAIENRIVLLDEAP